MPDRATPDDLAKTFTDAGIPSYHCDDPTCGCEKPGRWWTREAREGRRDQRRETWQDIRQAWSRPPPEPPVGTGGPPGSDAHTACSNCRGRGREDDGTPTPPVWHDAHDGQPAGWYDPATGRPVDLLAEPPTPAETHPAEPYQSPVEVCAICDQPASAHPKADHSPEGYDPEDGHHYCPKGRRCPACQTRPEQPAKPSTPRPNTTTSTSGAAAMSSAVSYGSLKARILNIGTNLTDAQGPLQQLVQCVDDQIAELAATSEDSNHAGIQEALGNLMRAKESIEEAGWMIGAAQASTEGAAAELS